MYQSYNLKSDQKQLIKKKCSHTNRQKNPDNHYSKTAFIGIIFSL